METQLLRFATLRATDPEKAKFIHAQGELLAKLATEGSLRRVRVLVDNSDPGELLTYFVVRAFKAALTNGHLMVAGYFLDNGYPLNRSVFLAISISISLTHTLNLSLSHTHTHTHTNSLSHIQSLSLTTSLSLFISEALAMVSPTP